MARPKKKPEPDPPPFVEPEVRPNATRCGRCTRCKTFSKLTAKREELSHRGHNMAILQHPCVKWEYDVMRALFKIIAGANHDVRPHKTVLRKVAEDWGFEDILDGRTEEAAVAD